MVSGSEVEPHAVGPTFISAADAVRQALQGKCDPDISRRVLAAVRSLNATANAIAIARCARHGSPCHCGHRCCSGRRANAEWLSAIVALADESARVLPRTHFALRQALIRNVFGPPVKFAQIAQDLSADSATVAKKFKVVHRWLAAPDIGLECRTWHEVTTALQVAGLLQWGVNPP
jgi:hypothetical protein